MYVDIENLMESISILQWFAERVLDLSDTTVNKRVSEDTVLSLKKTQISVEKYYIYRVSIYNKILGNFYIYSPNFRRVWVLENKDILEEWGHFRED